MSNIIWRINIILSSIKLLKLGNIKISREKLRKHNIYLLLMIKKLFLPVYYCFASRIKFAEGTMRHYQRLLTLDEILFPLQINITMAVKFYFSRTM